MNENWGQVTGAYGIDDSPDHSTLYVGTLIGDVYTIDPVSMTVTHRYVASQIGPYGFLAFNALGMADGKVALLGAEGGIPSVDGSSAIAIWNPADNSISIYGTMGIYNGPPLPCGPFMGAIGGFARTADRTRVIVASIDSDGTLCEVDEATGEGNFVASTGKLYHLLTSPDGKYIILPGYPGDALLYDAQTLNLVGQFPVSGDTSSASGWAVSADSKTLFTPTDSLIYAYDLITDQQVGWMPNIFLSDVSGGFAVGPAWSANLQAIDGTGLLAGPMEEGIGFVDSAAMQTTAPGTLFTNAYLNPANGPTSRNTEAQWGTQMPPSGMRSIFFGGQMSPSFSDSNGNITALTPPGAPGPADVYAFGNDGGMEIVPEGYSYGPTILEVTPNMSTAEGTGVGLVYGYGLVPVTATTIPSDLQVSVGGTAVTILGFNPEAYNLLSPPFQLQSVTFTIPPGVAGPADVTVSNNSGTATASGSLTYLPATQQYPLSGAALAEGIYDSHRDVYYFSDASKVQVFSLTQKQWLTPINIPAPAGAAQRLWSLSLSPDGSKLAVADAQGSVIYLLNPSSPSSVQTFPVLQQGSALTNPAGVAVTDSGIIYYVAYVLGGTGYMYFFKLDSNTGIIETYDIEGPGLGSSDMYLRTVLSYDNARVYFNDLGYIFSIDTATDTIFSQTTGIPCCYGDYELALSNNQIQLDGSSYLYDADLNAQSFTMLNDRELLNYSYVYGAKLSPDGTLLLQPSTNGMDVFDGRLGTYQDRIAFPFTLTTNYDAVAVDGKDNILLVITGATGTGIAVVDLTSIAEPPPLPYLRKHLNRALQMSLRNRPAQSRRPNQQKPPLAKLRHIPHVMTVPAMARQKR